tara:strand:+ start:3649 stop:3957 length:309 start_codon:yes stop_codon:yes gene_type:complete
MKNNPTMDLIAETYMQSIAPTELAVTEIDTGVAGGCPQEPQSCSCGNCEECCQDNPEQSDDLQARAAELIAQLTDVLSKLGAGKSDQSISMFNTGAENGEGA